MPHETWVGKGSRFVNDCGDTNEHGCSSHGRKTPRKTFSEENSNDLTANSQNWAANRVLAI
jgi:hypothetical protein